MIQITDMTFRIAGRSLFDEASATIPDGHKVGLVGRNGTGKSTLLKLLTDEYHPDGGEILVSGGRGVEDPIGMVSQEAPSGPDTPLEVVLRADKERERLLTEAETTDDPMRIAEVQTRLADIGAHAAPARAAAILAGLGFDDAMQAAPMSSFSGGWRMRVALAAVLFAEPEILLLDEPTNHLDLEATVWLEAYLARYPKTLVIVSHDRGLLNKAVDAILHLENLKLTLYQGGYDRFEKTREERLAQIEAQRAKQSAQRKHMEAFIERFRYKASKARQAQSRIKALERMEKLPDAVNEPTTRFSFPNPEELPPPLVTFDNASVGYEPGKTVLKGLGFRIDGDDRIGLLGRNGNGKSTLAKLIAGRLAKFDGDEHRSAKLRVGFFAQHQIEDLDPEATPAEHMARLMPGALPDKVRARLGGVGLVQDKQTTKAKHLSGGEKARLTLALITYDSPHVLILDEPTNHLDIDARDALVQALNDYTGAVILISHDRRLLELTVDRLWLVANGTVKPYEGDLDGYRDWLRQEERAARVAASEDEPDKKNDRKQARQASAEKRRQTADIRKKIREAEKKLEKLTQRKAQLEERLADPKIYEGPTADLKEVILKKEAVDREIESAEAEWLEAESALEEAS
ncbi:ATP-binding cassette domain-containing protein [Nisaea acidiphila]|uniref:ATP-binding cassette domain-containing protein n=1 Tax=Nisaea acidiphila TaxID=1862145 RepID=A0A9J7AS62_9PROT|nr:ATP-binding cassette domain-containing protein [Nisaea acidiphila]UUX50054.1 ATP-binding cassette domain-containing protein [Nisaea acidiphila]